MRLPLKIGLSSGLALGLIMAITDTWNYAEPIFGMATVALSIAIYFQTRFAKRTLHSSRTTGTWVVALKVVRPVETATQRKFGQLDVLINVEDIIHTNTLSLPEHYEVIAKAVYKACEKGQGKNIHLCLSGPVSLNFLIGQLIGISKFNITVYQYDPNGDQYLMLPQPNNDWLS